MGGNISEVLVELVKFKLSHAIHFHKGSLYSPYTMLLVDVQNFLLLVFHRLCCFRTKMPMCNF